MSEEKDRKTELHIGRKLKEARQAKGMTLDDLQQSTKIQKRYLIAIEDENFDELPGDFYVRAFVKQYANTVGLNGADLLKDYDEQLPETKTATYSDHLDEAVETRRGRQHQVAADRIDQLRHYLPTIIVILVVVVILGGIWLTAIVRNHQNASTKIDSSSVKVSGESSHKAKKTVKKTRKKFHKSNVKLTESSRTTNAVVYHSNSLKSSTKLTISNSGTGYNSVTVDGTQRLAKQMGANSKSTIVLAKNAKSITIRIGNPSQTKIKLGNKTINFTQNKRYPYTRTVTITFGNQESSSSTASSISNQSRTTTSTNSTGTSRSTGTTTTNNNTVNSNRTANQQTATTTRSQTQTGTQANNAGTSTNAGRQ